MTRRTRGREIALQVLYQTEQNPGMPAVQIQRFIERRLRADRKLTEFAEALVAGVQEHRPRLDELIAAAAENWRLDRMAAIDRNILRLGAFEMLYCDDVPTKVAINEALELAKRYSTSQSSRFVNGILDRLQVHVGAPEAKAAEAEVGATADAEVVTIADAEADVPATPAVPPLDESPEPAAEPVSPEPVPPPESSPVPEPEPGPSPES